MIASSMVIAAMLFIACNNIENLLDPFVLCVIGIAVLFLIIIFYLKRSNVRNAFQGE